MNIVHLVKPMIKWSENNTDKPKLKVDSSRNPISLLIKKEKPRLI
jgi:hypothetical protein